ncbi:MAG: beta-ketoacyl synthase N-terminal-like domain-containing protein [Microcoleaceae cyanobacterium]
MTNPQLKSTDIAIIGMSALFPGAPDLKTYWQNIVNGTSAIREAPEDWLGPYFDPDSTENDRIYNRKGGFIGDLAEFNPLEFGIMPNSVDGGEPVHFLALKLARAALADAGYLDRPFNRDKTGVILGRGTYVNRAYNSLMQHGLVIDQTLDLIRQLLPQLTKSTVQQIRQNLKQSLPPFTAEMAPGLSPNVLTGRIANRFDLKGPNYIVDAACASTLIAVELAITELQSGRCDLVLTGGTQASTPPQIHMIFCQLGALSRSDIKPFAQGSVGTLLSEGLGLLVLKRLADAERDGDRIYAVIKGVGTSSDGKALGLLAPRPEGEVLALQRAYANSGVDPQTISLIEAHGTGIPLGDRTEIQSLTQVFGARQHFPRCALGSVKSMIGHCLPAAGAASLIKMALALYHKVLPPTLCDQVNPDLEIEQTPFYINTETRPWIQGDGLRRAGVNSFGFGGVNGHAVLEEYQPSTRSLSSTALHTQWPTELVVLTADDPSTLIVKIQQLHQQIETQLVEAASQFSLASLAYILNSQPLQGRERLAIVAEDLPDLQQKLTQTLSKLRSQPQTLQTRNGIYYAAGGDLAEPERLALLFPGEGSQYPNMLADLCLYFPVVRSWFDFLDQTFGAQREIPPSHFIFPPPTSLTAEEQRIAQAQLFNMDLASETVFTANLALYELLKQLGLKAAVMVGHSTGENSALIASGTVRLSSREQLGKNMRHLNRIYQGLVAEDRIPKGVLLNVGAVDQEVLHRVIAQFQGQLHLAMNNCRNQAILFGDEAVVVQAQAQLQQLGGICTRLPFDRAYHTSRFEPISTAFKAFYDHLDVGPGQTSLYSCATADQFPTEPEAIRELAAQQWSRQVRFWDTMETCYQRGIRTFVEVGPSRNLTGFVRDVFRDRNHLALASNVQRQSGLTQLHHLLGHLWVQGSPLNLDYLYSVRELQPANLATPIVPPKPKMLLDLKMPILRLDPELVQEIQGQLQKFPSVLPEIGLPEISLPKIGLSGSDQTDPHDAPEQPSIVLQHPVSVTEDTVEWVVAPEQVQASSSNSEIARGIIEPDNSRPMAPVLIPPPVQLEPVASTIPLPPQLPSQQPEFSLLCSHFDLMKTFLEHQQRITAAVFSNSPDVATTPWPFLGQVQECTASRFYSERVFDLQSDRFLQDHTLGGQLSNWNPEICPLAVIPFTISLEILAEAAVYLTACAFRVTAIEAVRGYRWITLDQGQVRLGIEAELQSDPAASSPQVQVKLFQLEPDQQADPILVFEGRVILATDYPPPPAPSIAPLTHLRPSRWLDGELYTSGMFHGPSFQGVKHLCGWNGQGIEAELRQIPTDPFFQSLPRPQFQLDAGLLDAAGQLVAYWISEQSNMDFHAFPFRVQAFRFYADVLPAEAIVGCRGQIGFAHERQVDAQLELRDSTGAIITRIEGWQDVFFTVPQRFCECRVFPQTAFLSRPWKPLTTLTDRVISRRVDPFPQGFLQDSGGLLQRALAHLVLSAEERDVWYSLPEGSSRRLDWLLGRIAAKDGIRQWAQEQFQLALAPVDITILSSATGKPQVSCPMLQAFTSLPDLSISHSQGWAVAAIAPVGQQIGVDVQPFQGVKADDIIPIAFSGAEWQRLPDLTGQEIIGLWCAKEAASKAMGVGLHQPHDWQITHYSRETSEVALRYGDRQLLIQVELTPEEAIAICQIVPQGIGISSLEIN